jgi:predicted aminopeptidase
MQRLGSRVFSLVLVASAVCVPAAIGGCGTLGYYWQAFDGQMDVVRRARPIPDVIDDPVTDGELRVKLERVREIRDFASSALHLPDNGSYRRYADLGRPFVVWNVFAAPELAVEPTQWCFPIAGCVSYRGYFSEAAAEAFARELRTQGQDVYVGGVPAYSTLGWANDPVLNTFIRYAETEVARLIFHELSHQVAYAPGDTAFNESFAVTVENAGVARWLDAHGTAAQRSAFEAAQVRKSDFAALVARYRERLQVLYAQPVPPQDKLAAKARTFAEMRADYAGLKERWGGFAGYDWWFQQPLNNAQLASVALYTEFVPAFQQLLHNHGDDLRTFYAAVQSLAKLPQEKRDAALAALSGAQDERLTKNP